MGMRSEFRVESCRSAAFGPEASPLLSGEGQGEGSGPSLRAGASSSAADELAPSSAPSSPARRPASPALPEPGTPDSDPRTLRAGGRHVLVDFWTDDASALRHVGTWEALLPDACRDAGATVLGSRFHQFAPDGVTGIVLLAESHASVHTWPEAGLATLDVFTCGSLDAEAVVQRIREALDPVRERVSVVLRGDAAPDLPTPIASSPAEPDGD